MTEIETNPYPTLFSHPRLIADLLRGYVREPWVSRLDLGSLEPWTGPDSAPPASGSTPEEPPAPASAAPGGSASEPGCDVDREPGLIGDVLETPTLIWRLRWRGGRSWVYLLVALPDRVDRHLALRLLLRAVHLHLDLAAADALHRSGRLPAIVPLVVYTGEALWTAPRDLGDLFEPVPHALDRYLLRFRYRLLDAAREPVPESADDDNLVSALFRLERSRTLDDVEREAARLERLLAVKLGEPGTDGLCGAFTSFIGDPLLPRRFGAVLPILGTISPLGLGSPSRWSEERRGLALLLMRLLENRFGPLRDDERKRIEEAEPECILAWGERSAGARSIEEVLGA